MQTFDYGNVLAQGEQIKGARTQNQMLQGKQQLENTKMLYAGLSQISQNPESAEQVVPELQKAGIMRSDFDYSQMSMEERASKAAEGAAGLKANLDAMARASTSIKPVAGPASVQETNWFLKQTPEVQKQHLNVKRANRLYDVGSGFQSVDPVSQQPTGELLPKDLTPSQEIPYIKAAEAGKVQTRADIESVMKPETAGKVVRVQEAEKERSGVIKDTTKQINVMIKQNQSMDKVISELDKGASTGPFMSRLKSLTASSQRMDQLQREMGLEVVGGTAFGALSESELAFALQTAIPTNLRPKELANWAREKQSANKKMMLAMLDLTAHMRRGGNIEEWQQQFASTEQPPAAEAQAMSNPQTEADYNALPSGSIYIDPDDGKQYRKP